MVNTACNEMVKHGAMIDNISVVFPVFRGFPVILSPYRRGIIATPTGRRVAPSTTPIPKTACMHVFLTV